MAMSGPDLIFYGAIAVAIIGLFAFPFLHQRKKRAEPPPVPVQPKPRTRPTPPPPAAKSTPKPASQKSADQVFREAFPGVRLKPYASKPFCVRAETCELRDKISGEIQSGFRIDVCGGFEVRQDLEVDLVVTLEDVSEGASQQVYATQERHQDEQTGLFVLRTTVGKVSAPGREDSGWTAVGVVPFANIRAPKSGDRTLRLSCLAVPSFLSGLTIVDERLRSGMLAAATVTFDVRLSRKGYVEQRFARQNAAGLVVCLGFAFAVGIGRERQKSAACVQEWMTTHLSHLKGEEEALIERIRLTMQAAYGMAGEARTDADVICRELLAYDVPGMASQGLKLCVDIVRVDGVVPSAALPGLKDICRALDLSLQELHQRIDAGAKERSGDSDQELARLVGLDLAWDPKRIRRHLLDQFMKWNARHPKTAEEREIISRQLEAVARLRKRYL